MCGGAPWDMGQFGSGASLAFKTAALHRLGGFAAELGAGTRALGREDLDIFLRRLASGAAIVYEPGAILRHRHQRDDAALRRQLHGYGVGLGRPSPSACWTGRRGPLTWPCACPPAWPTCSARRRPRTGASRPTSPASSAGWSCAASWPAAYLRSRRQSCQTRM